jgi:hypothetical protein
LTATEIRRIVDWLSREIAMPKYTVLDFVADVLREQKFPLSYKQIYAVGKTTTYFKKVALRGSTPAQTIGANLYVDVRDNPDSRFIKVGKTPALFFLKSRQSELTKEMLEKLESTKPVHTKKGHAFPERRVHPILSYYAFSNPAFNKGRAIYTRTIFHERSKKGGLNEWIHPDMVGFYMPIDDWSPALLEFNKVSYSRSIKLFSFEVKKDIDRSNYREYFFQAVSNSSWANESYLACIYIEDDDDLMAELARLSFSFGVGIVLLKLEDVDSSEVLFPAKHRLDLDWELMNKLCEQNRDFEKFLDDVRKDYEVKTIHSSEYDKIEDDIDAYIRQISR